MITLHKMTEDGFRAFRQSSVSEYTSDLMKGRELSPEQALKEAEEEFDMILPDGLETKYSYLMNIEDANENKVGWIFFKYIANGEDDQSYVFLEDLLIFKSERRKGFASAAIKEMNTQAKKDGCSSSALFVWDHNPDGLRLYKKCGYKVESNAAGGVYMVKEL